MVLLLLIYVVLRALWKIDVHLISTLVHKSLYYYYYYYKQRGPLMGLEPTTSTLRVRRATHCATLISLDTELFVACLHLTTVQFILCNTTDFYIVNNRLMIKMINKNVNTL